MKKTILVFVIAAMILISAGIWFFTSSEKLSLADIISFAVITLVLAFAIVFGFKRLASAKRGEPVEDELSKKVMQKTAAWSYYISIYLWLFIMYVQDKVRLETHTIIGSGILGMAVVFVLCWLVIHFKGLRNE